MAKCLTLAFISIIILISKPSYPLESAMHKAEVAKCYVLSSFFSSNVEIVDEGIKEYSQNIYDKAVLKIKLFDISELSINEMRQMLNLKDIYEPLVSKKEFQRIEEILNVCSNTLKIGK